MLHVRVDESRDYMPNIHAACVHWRTIHVFWRNQRFMTEITLSEDVLVKNVSVSQSVRMMQDLNRSDRSDLFQDRELIEAVLQPKKDETCRLNDSGGSRLSAVLPPRSNGNLSRPSSFVSRRSITLSQEKLSDAGDAIFEQEECSNSVLIERIIKTMCLLCVASLILGVLSIQVLLALANTQHVFAPGLTVIDSNVTYEDVLEVATAMCTFVVVLDITCLLVCSIQTLIVVELLKVQLGEERALKYLKDCSSSRFIAIIGFFVSIPSFLVCVILYIFMRFRSTPAITACVILVVGFIFCVLSVMQNCYHWRIEKGRASEGLPVYDIPPNRENKEHVGKELSTLV